MRRYVVSWMSYFDNDLRIIVVEGDLNPIEAMIEGARQCMGDPMCDPWLASFSTIMPAPEDYESRIAEIQEKFGKANQVVSEPLLIE